MWAVPSVNVLAILGGAETTLITFAVEEEEEEEEESQQSWFVIQTLCFICRRGFMEFIRHE